MNIQPITRNIVKDFVNNLTSKRRDTQLAQISRKSRASLKKTVTMTSFSKQINQDLLLDQQMSILSKSKSGKIPENNIALNPKLNQIVKLVLENKFKAAFQEIIKVYEDLNNNSSFKVRLEFNYLSLKVITTIIYQHYLPRKQYYLLKKSQYYFQQIFQHLKQFCFYVNQIYFLRTIEETDKENGPRRSSMIGRLIKKDYKKNKFDIVAIQALMSSQRQQKNEQYLKQKKNLYSNRIFKIFVRIYIAYFIHLETNNQYQEAAVVINNLDKFFQQVFSKPQQTQVLSLKYLFYFIKVKILFGKFLCKMDEYEKGLDYYEKAIELIQKLINTIFYAKELAQDRFDSMTKAMDLMMICLQTMTHILFELEDYDRVLETLNFINWIIRNFKQMQNINFIDHYEKLFSFYYQEVSSVIAEQNEMGIIIKDCVLNHDSLQKKQEYHFQKDNQHKLYNEINQKIYEMMNYEDLHQQQGIMKKQSTLSTNQTDLNNNTNIYQSQSKTQFSNPTPRISVKYEINQFIQQSDPNKRNIFRKFNEKQQRSTCRPNY